MELLENKSYQALIAACILKIGSAGITVWGNSNIYFFSYLHSYD